MPKKKTRLDRFSDLTWNDIEKWAGGKIVSRGKSYQRQGRVSDLAVTDAGSLITWVDGMERYATRVVMDEDGPACLMRISVLKAVLGGTGLMKTPLPPAFKPPRRIGR